jgi:shikimate dehydrogenase
MSVAQPNVGSPGPAMHNAGFAHLGLDFVYLAFEPTSLVKVFDAMRTLGIRGCSVSRPFKVEALALLDEVDETARDIGAVNTVVNDAGVLSGFNTDWTGVTRALDHHVDPTGLRVAVVGAGGAAQAAVYGLKRAGAAPVVFNRSVSRARAVADRFDVACGGSLADVTAAGPFDVLVNATSLGRLVEDVSPVDLSGVEGLSVVLDMSFAHRSTSLMDQARSLRLSAVHGADMLVEQGAVQFELYTGQQAPVEVMRSSLFDQLGLQV